MARKIVKRIKIEKIRIILAAAMTTRTKEVTMTPTTPSQ